MKLVFTFGICSSLIVLAACSSSSKKSFPDSVEKTIESNQSEFDKCYDFTLKHKRDSDPAPVGRIEVGFTVSPAGKVTESNIISTDVNDNRLEKCVQETLRRTQFPANDQGRLTQTTYPFDFGKK